MFEERKVHCEAHIVPQHEVAMVGEAREDRDEIKHLRGTLRGLLELVLAIQENNPALFIPSLDYNQRVMAAKDTLGAEYV